MKNPSLSASEGHTIPWLALRLGPCICDSQIVDSLYTASFVRMGCT